MKPLSALTALGVFGAVLAGGCGGRAPATPVSARGNLVARTARPPAPTAPAPAPAPAPAGAVLPQARTATTPPMTSPATPGTPAADPARSPTQPAWVAGAWQSIAPDATPVGLVGTPLALALRGGPVSAQRGAPVSLDLLVVNTDGIRTPVTLTAPLVLSVEIRDSGGRTRWWGRLPALTGTVTAADDLKFSWNQRDSGGGLVPAGTYEAVLHQPFPQVLYAMGGQSGAETLPTQGHMGQAYQAWIAIQG